MEERRKWMALVGISVLALAFSTTAVFTPWWRISTTKEYEITTTTSIGAQYGLFQTVSAHKAIKNEDGSEISSITIPFANLTGKQADKGALSTLFNTALVINSLAIVLTALTLMLLLASALRKPLFHYAKFTGIIAAVVLLAATFFFATGMQPLVSKLDSVIPNEIHVLRGKEVNGFWGDKTNAELQSLQWGPAFGWFLAFTAFLLNMLTFVLVHTLYGKKVK